MIGKVLTLSVLYFVQGLPYGFQDKFIPMYLRSTGLSHTKLSLMKLLLVPWLCKAAFGPLIDLKWSKWLWLLLSLGALTVISFCGIFINTEYFVLMCVWLLLLNLFSAFQDVSVDALALHILRECEMGHGNTAQVVGYKLGSLFGGGILFWIHYYHGWNYLCLSLTSLYIMSIIAFLPMYIRNSLSYDKIFVKKKKGKESFIHNLKDSPVSNDEGDSPVFDQDVMGPFSTRTSHENLFRRKSLERSTSESGDDSVATAKSSETQIRRYSICEIPQQIFATKGTVPAIIFLFLYKLGKLFYYDSIESKSV